MTIEQGWENAEWEQDQEAGEWGHEQAVPVKVEFEQTQQVAPESTAWMYWPVAIVGQSDRATQLVPHRYHRYKAKMLWTVPAGVTVYIDQDNSRLTSNSFGTTFQFTAPAAGFTSQQVLPDYDGQQPVYAMASGAGVSVAVMDESYKEVQ